MLKVRYAALCFIFLFAFSCTGTTSNNNVADTANENTSPVDSIVGGKVIAQVTCKSSPAQSYALYIPAGMQDKILPVIYFFDPHAAGSLPLDKYKSLADRYQFILAGSNNSKNGTDLSSTENIWQALVTDTKKRLHIDTSHMYVCGFSGGAKTASFIALKHQEIKAVIAGGAALPDGTTAGNFPFSFTALAGEGDLNMTDLIATNNDFDRTATRHRIIFFKGIHEWAPESSMSIAFAGLLFDGMRERTIPENDSLIAAYAGNSKKNIAAFINANDLINAERECKLSVNMLDGLTDEAKWFKQKDAAIKSNTAYHQQWKAMQELLQKEENTKNSYMQQFQQGDISYWTSTINNLQAKSKAATAEGAMNQRLLAYLSLSFYSLSNHFIKAGVDDQAAYFNNLYKLADSTNSEAWYFSAILNARRNNPAAAKADLLKAVDLGFDDKTRMLRQIEFQVIADDINLEEIVTRIK